MPWKRSDDDSFPPALKPHNGPCLPYYRNGDFERFLRRIDVPFTDAVCSLEPDGRIFDAEIIVPGERAIESWWKLRNADRRFPYHPVIRAVWSDLSNYHASPVYQLDPGRREQQAWEDRRKRGDTSPWAFELSPSEIRADAHVRIEAASEIPPEPWNFRSKRPPPPSPSGANLEYPPSLADPAVLFSPDGPFLALQRFCRDWPYIPLVRLRLFPCVEPWEVFAYSPSGGWNLTPWPDEQLAMYRHWYERYGAELVSDTGESVELYISRPPCTRHNAIRLLQEMESFGEEIVLPPRRQSSFEEDILEVRTSHYWYFWWD